MRAGSGAGCGRQRAGDTAVSSSPFGGIPSLRAHKRVRRQACMLSRMSCDDATSGGWERCGKREKEEDKRVGGGAAAVHQCPRQEPGRNLRGSHRPASSQYLLRRSRCRRRVRGWVAARGRRRRRFLYCWGAGRLAPVASRRRIRRFPVIFWSICRRKKKGGGRSRYSSGRCQSEGSLFGLNLW